MMSGPSWDEASGGPPRPQPPPTARILCFLSCSHSVAFLSLTALRSQPESTTGLCMLRLTADDSHGLLLPERGVRRKPRVRRASASHPGLKESSKTHDGRRGRGAAGKAMRRPVDQVRFSRRAGRRRGTCTPGIQGRGRSRRFRTDSFLPRPACGFAGWVFPGVLRPRAAGVIPGWGSGRRLRLRQLLFSGVFDLGLPA